MSYCLLVHAFDGYEFLFKPFMKSIRPHLREKIFFATEEIDFVDEDVINIKTGKGSWSARLKRILENPLLDEYDATLYTQEDLLIQHIDWQTVDDCYNVMEMLQADIIKFGNFYEFTTEPIGIINGLPVRKQRGDSQYIMSHQPVSLFSKEYLLSTLVRDEDASSHELTTTKVCPDSRVFCVGNVFRPNKSETIEYSHTIRKGQIIPEAEEYLYWLMEN